MLTRPILSHRFWLVLFFSSVIFSFAACQADVPNTPTVVSRARQAELTRFAEATRKAERTVSAVHEAVSGTQTQAAAIRNAGSPTPLPTYTTQPTYTPLPSYTAVAPTAVRLPTLSSTPRPTFAPPFFPVEVSLTEFYCIQEPSEVKIYVRLPDDMGAAVYFRLREKKSRVMTDWEKKDLLPEIQGGRSAVINGSIYKPTPSDIPYPALPRESVLEYQIISDDGMYKSIVYTDITYFPCPAQN